MKKNRITNFITIVSILVFFLLVQACFSIPSLSSVTADISVGYDWYHGNIPGEIGVTQYFRIFLNEGFYYINWNDSSNKQNTDWADVEIGVIKESTNLFIQNFIDLIHISNSRIPVNSLPFTVQPGEEGYYIIAVRRIDETPSARFDLRVWGSGMSDKPGSEIIFNAHYLRGVYSSVPANRNIVVISSTRELEQYYHINRRQTGSLNLIWKESFFAENFLVLVNLIEPSGSIRHEVERIDPNGNIVIRRITPQIGTADMAGWNIFIEINNKNRAENYKIEVIDEYR